MGSARRVPADWFGSAVSVPSALIPQRSDQIEHEGRRQLDRRAYRRRSKVENSVGWLKENRRVGTRYDKLASSFLAFVNLAIIRRYLRILAPDDPSDRT